MRNSGWRVTSTASVKCVEGDAETETFLQGAGMPSMSDDLARGTVSDTLATIPRVP